MYMANEGWKWGGRIGFVGGLAASGYASYALWPLIIGAVPGAGGIVLAVVAACALLYPAAYVGSWVGAAALGTLGLFSDAVDAVFDCCDPRPSSYGQL